jgi:hypothetical protein
MIRMTDFDGQDLEAEPRSGAEAIAQIHARADRDRRKKEQAAAWAAEQKRQQARAVAARQSSQRTALTRRDITALAQAIVPFIRECVIAPLDKRLAELERACGLGASPKQPGVEAIAPVIRNYVEARLGPTAQRVHELSTDAMKYCGVYRREKTYQRGEVVTHNGGIWFCEETSDCKPGVDGSWKLVVKSGAFGDVGRIDKLEAAMARITRDAGEN